MFSQKKLSRALQFALGAGSGIAVLISGAALAQQQPQKIEKIEVTGTNIKRVDAETPAPIQIITREDIERSAQTTLADVLRNVPANTGNSFNETFSNSFSPGASGISLRGLGQKATLVLVNGRRVANYGFAQNIADTYVDLNSIPASAIERVEILKDGASSVYGSDAIGGVVNIITRRDYVGAEAAVAIGTSGSHDLDERTYSISGGIGTPGKDRFNVFGVLSYFTRDQLLASERSYTRDQDWRNRPGGVLSWSQSAGTYISVPGGPTRAPFPGCLGGQGTVLARSEFGTTGAAGNDKLCAYNPAPFLPLFPEAERTAFMSRGTFDFTDSVQGYAEVWLSHNETDQTFTPGAISSTGVVYNPANGGVRIINAVLPAGNPSNPYGKPVSFATTFFDVGPRAAHIETDFQRELLGVKGTFKGWDWDVGALYSKSETDQQQFNLIDALVLEREIADGSYNFLDPSKTPAASNALRITTHRKAESSLNNFDAKLSGEIVQLPAGPLAVAAGYEYRKESITDTPDALLSSGHVLGFGSTQTDGSRDDNAFFTEFNIPVLKNLEASVAGRWDHYSDFGSAFSPKVGFKWNPIKEVLFRGTWGKGFRAPTLPENSQSTALSFVAISDPTNNLTYNVARISAGNPELLPEKSKTWTLGAVFEPVQNVSFALDYWDIHIDNLVLRESGQTVVNNEGKPGFEGRILRDPVTGNIIYVVTPFLNVDYRDTSGIDLDYKIGVPGFPYGKLTFSGEWEYLIEWKYPLTKGAAATDFAGNNGFDNFSRVRTQNRVLWETGPWVSQLQVNYWSPVNQVNFAVPPADAYVKGMTTWDAYVAWKGIKNLTLSLAVQNLTDRDPPYDRSFGTPYNFPFSIFDARGRYFTLSGRYKFF
jgi:iron complex outermembrane receptor protein